MPAAKATILSRLLPHLEELKKTVGKLLGDGWDVAFADVVPQGPVVGQWLCPGCQSHCECQGKDVCLGQVAVLLQREGKGVRKEHLAALSKGEARYELKNKQPGKCVYVALPSVSCFLLFRMKILAASSRTNQEHVGSLPAIRTLQATLGSLQ